MATKIVALKQEKPKHKRFTVVGTSEGNGKYQSFADCVLAEDRNSAEELAVGTRRAACPDYLVAAVFAGYHALV